MVASKAVGDDETVGAVAADATGSGADGAGAIDCCGAATAAARISVGT